MGAGSSPPYVEAPYALHRPLPAGSWNLVGDGIVAGSGVLSATILFEVRWRRQGAISNLGDLSDLVVASVQHTFVRDPNNQFGAIPFSSPMTGIAAHAAADDLLILRTTFVAGDPGALFILNGDGKNSGGQIPRLDLPQ